MVYVYVVKSQTDGFHYIGHTESLDRRLEEHNSGKVRSSKAHRPYRIIYSEPFESNSEAQQREYFLKRDRGNVWLREFLRTQDL